MRTRCKFRVVGVEETEYKVFKKVFKADVTEDVYVALVGTEYTETYGLKKGLYKSVDTGCTQQNVRLAAQYDASNPEDVSFSEATPSGELRILVTNPVVVGNFKPGANYYLDLTPCE